LIRPCDDNSTVWQDGPLAIAARFCVENGRHHKFQIATLNTDSHSLSLFTK
jgi:hypothetical protein